MESLKKLQSLLDQYKSPTEEIGRSKATLSRSDVAGLLADQDSADQDSRGALAVQRASEEGERKPGSHITFGADTIIGKGGSKESEFDPAVESFADYKRRLLFGGDPDLKRPSPMGGIMAKKADDGVETWDAQKRRLGSEVSLPEDKISATPKVKADISGPTKLADTGEGNLKALRAGGTSGGLEKLLKKLGL